MTTAKNTEPVLTLVGCYFHTLDDDGCVQYQGRVRGNIGDGFFLIEYFEWFTGQPSKMELRHISEMKAGRWQFYEDSERMNNWLETWGKRREKLRDWDEDIEQNEPLLKSSGEPPEE